MNNVYIRPAELADLPVLYEFEQGIITTERPFDSTLDDDPITYYDIKAMIESDNVEVIVAIVENEVVGSAYARIEEAKPYLNHKLYAYLGFMYVKPEHRGQGINQQVVEALKTWAKSKNLTELRLDVYDENLPAIRAYEKAGFERHLLNMRMNIE